jgi:DNA-binding XRE family transcriptional regulator
MLGHMKKLHINDAYVKLLLQIPAPLLEEFMKTIASYEAKEIQITKEANPLLGGQWIPAKNFLSQQARLEKEHSILPKPFLETEEFKEKIKRIREVVKGVLDPCKLPSKELERFVSHLVAFCGVEQVKDSVPWEEVYPDFNASVALRGARKREGLSQEQLAQLVGANQVHISEMENSKRPIGKTMAKRLAKALNVDYRVFL